MGSPCQFGCTPGGFDGQQFICNCPAGYHRIGQGHCLNTITPPAYGGYDIEGPLSSEGSDRFLSTEGCFSCKVRQTIKLLKSSVILYCNLNIRLKVGASSRSGRGRRSINNSLNNNTTSLIRKNEIDDQLILMIPMEKTKMRYRILKLQPSIKTMVLHNICFLL